MFSARAVCLLLIVYFVQTSEADDACGEGACSYGDQYCYKVEFIPKNWTTGRDFCHQSMMMGFMADVHRSDVQSFLDMQTGTVDYWIGLNSLKIFGRWEWDVPDGAAYSRLDGYTNWAPGEPANDPNLRCVQVRHSGSNMGLCRIYDNICSIAKHTIHEFDYPFLNWNNKLYTTYNTYNIYSNYSNYNTYTTYRNTQPNAHLTSIASAIENANVDAVVTSTSSVSDCDQFWIGGSDFDQDGQFVWEDGSPWGYTKWALGQPDTTQQCISSTARTNGQWRTEPCGIKNCFICEMYMGG
uniref:C-type lectin domain-containing protein n=1 Tax=Plectus sambesii TaxID=2011161 RepID=A0A914WHN9_9BILA